MVVIPSLPESRWLNKLETQLEKLEVLRLLRELLEECKRETRCQEYWGKKFNLDLVLEVLDKKIEYEAIPL